MKRLAITLAACSQSDPSPPPPPTPPRVVDAAPIVTDAAVDAVVGTGEGSGVDAGGVTVTLGRPMVSGDLDKAIVSRIVRRSLARIRTCLAKQLAGTVVENFVVAPDGKVSASAATGVDPKAADCVAAAVRDLQFPASRVGVEVSFPFTFSNGPVLEAIEPGQLLDAKAAAGNDVARTVMAHLRDIKPCYTKALAKHPKLAGKVVAKFTIGADGKVTASTASGLDPEVADCIAAAIRAIEFPQPAGGKAVEQTFPFSFVAE